jgi:POT family proton-dependent oligopeptide transporter
MSKELTLAIYTKIGWVTVGVAMVVLALSPLVRRWMHLGTLGDRAGDHDLAGEPGLGLEAQEAGLHPARRTD